MLPNARQLALHWLLKGCNKQSPFGVRTSKKDNGSYAPKMTIANYGITVTSSRPGNNAFYPDVSEYSDQTNDQKLQRHIQDQVVSLH